MLTLSSSPKTKIKKGLSGIDKNILKIGGHSKLTELLLKKG